MSDDTTPERPADADADADAVTDPAEKSTPAAEGAVAAPVPPRPRSATSRARRIGGAATDATRPSPVAGAGEKDAKDPKGTDAAPADKPVALKKKPARRKAGDDTADGAKDIPARRKRAGAAAAATDDGDAGKAGVTISLPSWLVWAPSVAFVAIAAVFLTLFAINQAGGDDSTSATSDKTRQQVLAAAKTCLAALNTYRYNQLDEAEAAGTRCTTGQLTTQYKRTVATILRKNAPPLKAVQIAKINTAGIESVTANGKQWTILAYGQLNITTANTGAQGRVDPFASSARLQQVKGKWVLSKIDTVSSFSS